MKTILVMIAFVIFICTTGAAEPRGVQLTITWTQSLINPSVVTGYKLYIRSSDSSLPNSVNVGNNLKYTLNVKKNSKNYFKVAAYTKDGDEGPPSAEVYYRPK